MGHFWAEKHGNADMDRSAPPLLCRSSARRAYIRRGIYSRWSAETLTQLANSRCSLWTCCQQALSSGARTGGALPLPCTRITATVFHIVNNSTICVQVTDAYESDDEQTDDLKRNKRYSHKPSTTNLCGICMESRERVKLKNCRHNLCTGCARQLLEVPPATRCQCPFCREYIRGFAHV